MKALSQAIFAKCAVGTSLYTAIGGRLYKGRAPQPTTYPYVVYLLISDVPDPTFTESLEHVLIQFSVFSTASSSEEIEDIYTALKAIYDECTLTITGETLLRCDRQDATLSVEDHTTTSGTVEVWHYAVDYRISMQVP